MPAAYQHENEQSFLNVVGLEERSRKFLKTFIIQGVSGIFDPEARETCLVFKAKVKLPFDSGAALGFAH